MAKPSLNASPHGLDIANATLLRAGWTKQALRSQVGCSRQPITNFFKGAAIAQPIFMAICDQLGLDWQAIAQLPDVGVRPNASMPESKARISPTPSTLQPSLVPQPSRESAIPERTLAGAAISGTSIVEQVREQIRHYTLERCCALPLLGHERGRLIQAVEARLSILHSGDQYALQPIFASRSLPRQGTLQTDEAASSIPPELSDASNASNASLSGEAAVSRYPYLHVLGAPGSGKSTLLKRLAWRCMIGEFLPQRVPLYIALREIAIPLQTQDLFDCIAAIYQRTCHLEPELLRQLFAQGKVLLLLDGEDEIADELSKRLVLTHFNLFYGNHVVISCRTAAHQRLHAEFVQATIRPFSHGQIQALVHQWFQSEPQAKHRFFIWLQQIQSDDRMSADLAQTPLLLTLLCMIFERSSRLPQGKMQVYALAFENLLERWNQSHLTPQSSRFERRDYGDKLRILKAIARASFSAEGKCFEASQALLQAANLTEKDTAGLLAKDFFQELEQLYGLIHQEGWSHYRFAHLSFHEYLVALFLLDDLATIPAASDCFASLCQEILGPHLFQHDWYEVLLFVLEGLPLAQLERFLDAIAQQLQDYLSQQHTAATEQLEAGRAIAQQLAQLYQTSPHSPATAQNLLSLPKPLSDETAASELPFPEPGVILRAFCADYHYTFDLGRRISRALALDYQFSHDLVLAHCFKCNLNKAARAALKSTHPNSDSVEATLSFNDALIHVWQQFELHGMIQAVDSVTDVRVLFFQYVLTNPNRFRQTVVQHFEQFAQEQDWAGHVSGPEAGEMSHGAAMATLMAMPPQLKQRVSALVGQVSRPDQELYPFLQSQQLQFPTVAYSQNEAVAALKNYYHGCVLLCNGLRLRSDVSADQRQALLRRLF